VKGADISRELIFHYLAKDKCGMNAQAKRYMEILQEGF